MVCQLFGDSLEIGSRGEGLQGLWNMKQKVVWPPQSTVSGLRDFRRMLTSIWKILYGTICMLAKLRFSPSENIYLGGKMGGKKKLKVFIPTQSFPSTCSKCGFCPFGTPLPFLTPFHNWVLLGLKWLWDEWVGHLDTKYKELETYLEVVGLNPPCISVFWCPIFGRFHHHREKLALMPLTVPFVPNYHDFKHRKWLFYNAYYFHSAPNFS